MHLTGLEEVAVRVPECERGDTAAIDQLTDDHPSISEKVPGLACIDDGKDREGPDMLGWTQGLSSLQFPQRQACGATELEYGKPFRWIKIRL